MMVKLRNLTQRYPIVFAAVMTLAYVGISRLVSFLVAFVPKGYAADAIYEVAHMFWPVAVAILLFAFTTVLGWSQYGSKAVEYLGGKRAKQAYQVFFVLLIMSGAMMTSSLAWDISDTFNGLMMIPNLIGVIVLSGQVKMITQNYIDRKIKKKDVAPLLSYDPRIQKQMEDELAAEAAAE